MQHSAVNPLLLRFVAYAALIAVIFEGIVLAVGAHGGHWVMQDDGPVEILQLAVAFSTALVFWATSRRESAWADLYRLCSALSLMACARELDNFTLQLGSRDAYLVIALFPALWAASVLARIRWKVFELLAEFSNTPGFALLLVGFFVVVVYAQLIGQKALWMAVLDVDTYRPIKEIVEESSELLGYLLMLFGAVEAAMRDRGE